MGLVLGGPRHLGRYLPGSSGRCHSIHNDLTCTPLWFSYLGKLSWGQWELWSSVVRLGLGHPSWPHSARQPRVPHIRDHVGLGCVEVTASSCHLLSKGTPLPRAYSHCLCTSPLTGSTSTGTPWMWTTTVSSTWGPLAPGNHLSTPTHCLVPCPLSLIAVLNHVGSLRASARVPLARLWRQLPGLAFPSPLLLFPLWLCPKPVPLLLGVLGWGGLVYPCGSQTGVRAGDLRPQSVASLFGKTTARTLATRYQQGLFAGRHSMLTFSAPSAGLSISVGGKSGSSSHQGKKKPYGTVMVACPTM